MLGLRARGSLAFLLVFLIVVAKHRNRDEYTILSYRSTFIDIYFRHRSEYALICL